MNDKQNDKKIKLGDRIFKKRRRSFWRLKKQLSNPHRAINEISNIFI